MLQACAFTPEGGGALTLQELAARDGFAASDGTAVLQALLDPLLPGGVPGCRPASLVLDMDFAYLAPLAPLPHERCPVLAHLTRLCLRCCPGGPEDEEIAADMQAFLAASLPRMGRLRQLSLEVHGRQLPESVLALPALHSLVLSGPGLQLMPAGTLLQGGPLQAVRALFAIIGNHSNSGHLWHAFMSPLLSCPAVCTVQAWRSSRLTATCRSCRARCVVPACAASCSPTKASGWIEQTWRRCCYGYQSCVSSACLLTSRGGESYPTGCCGGW